MTSTISSARMSRRMELAASGWALSAALVALFVLCLIVAVLWPTPAFSHAWIQLFTSAPIGSLANLIEGVAASVAVAWVTAGIFVPIYNWLARD